LGVNHSWRQFTAGNAAGRFVLSPADDEPCGGRGVNGGLLARAVVAASGMTTDGGAVAGWLFTAPAGTSIVGLDYDRWAFRYGRDYSDGIDDSRWSMRAITSSSTPFESATGNVVALPGSPGRTQLAWPAGATSTLAVTVLCRDDFHHGPCENFGVPYGATIGGLDIQQRRAQFNIYGATVTLEDDHGPTLGDVGGSLAGGGWHTGATESLVFTADDAGGGVASGSLTVAGTGARADTCDPAADVAMPVPCPLHVEGQAISLDTGAVPEGRHTALLTVSDVAGNTATTAFQVDVDRTPPTAELARAPDDYGRTVVFTDVADNVSGVDAASAAAEYSDDDGATWQPMPGSLSGDTYTAQVPQSVPAGTIRVRVHLQDAAGNATIIGGSAGEPVTVASPTAAPACSDGVDDDGDGLIDAADPGCVDPQTGRYVPARDSESAIAVLGTKAGGQSLLVGCAPSRLVLLDVRRVGRRVALSGATRPEWAGRVVRIFRSWDGRRVASVPVTSRGTFATRVALPPRAIRYSNRARYQGRLGARTTLALKLVRRLTISAMRARPGRRVEITGRIIGPRDVRAPVVVKRMVTCGSYKIVRTFQPRRDGTFRVVVPAPARARGAVYRLSTRVRRLPASRRTSLTFSLPRAIDF
jgi:hypothetical protein